MTVYRMISAEKASTPVSVCCRLLGVSRSGYYEWASRAPSDRALTDAWLIEKIKRIHSDHRKVYGSPRIHADLRLAHGIRVSRKRVERLMREAGISGLVRRKRGRTTISVPGVRVADDLVTDAAAGEVVREAVTRGTDAGRGVRQQHARRVRRHLSR